MIYLGKHKLKPYNITNFSQKNSIALAYLDEKKKSYSSNQYVKVRNMNNVVYADDENLQKDDEV